MLIDIQFYSSYNNSIVLFCFSHECASGYYRVSAYFLAKISSEILSLHVIFQLIFSAIIYFMTGEYM